MISKIISVSSGQIKSLLTGHNIGNQTIFLKPSAATTIETQAGQQTTQVSPTHTVQTQVQQRVIPAQSQTQGVQRLIAQIGGKPVAVQIQQSPPQQQQKVYAKMLTPSGQLMTVESLLAQKGLKLATSGTQARSTNKIIPTQYQVG